ncbi:MAG: hypothetical protein BIFFINMI_03207 [Phycisphaerae bacterium]|nr:hypothetical protein [Phycisphaerae bacterium]
MAATTFAGPDVPADAVGRFAIRPFAPIDAPAVRAICIQAGWRGIPADSFLDHPEVWADFWTGYYLARQPQHCCVAADASGRVVGYLTGCPDTAAADRFVAWRVVPALVGRALAGGWWLRTRDRRFFARVIRAGRRGELAIPRAIVRDYPGHFHFNLLPAARGQGLGAAFYDRFESQMRREGVRGLHGQVLGSNPVVIGFSERRGYRVAHRAHAASLDGWIEPGPVELVTLVKSLA